MGALTLTYLFFGWHRRWICDDGLIVTRTVRQVLAGHGPVFNAGQRVEVNTSTVWTYLLVVAGWVTGKDIAPLAVGCGLILAVVGLALGMDASRRLHLRVRPGATFLPLGALVVVALPPLWDFATSGLETGLTFGWLGATYWALVRLGQPAPRWFAALAAVLVGLGPLVRPEMTVVTAAALPVMWFLRGLGIRRAVRLVGCAGVLPVAYELFRMGYYGMIVPQTAIAKEAGNSVWGRGLTYAWDFADPYVLWIPLLVTIAAVTFHLIHNRRDSVTVVLMAMPLACSVALCLYVIRLGGDFMHARMLLAPLLLLVLPVLLVPVRPVWAGLTIPVAAWAIVCIVTLRVNYMGIALDGIANERMFWVTHTRDPHPVTAAPFEKLLSTLVPDYRAQGSAGFAYILHDRVVLLPVRAGVPWRFSAEIPNIGMGGASLSLDEGDIDSLGLADPLAAHMQLDHVGRAGHEKELPDAFLLADLTPPDVHLPADAPSSQQVAAARRALSCGEVAEMQRAVQGPLTVSRFWTNLIGAIRRTSFRIPDDPQQAADSFCGPH